MATLVATLEATGHLREVFAGGRLGGGGLEHSGGDGEKKCDRAKRRHVADVVA